MTLFMIMKKILKLFMGKVDFGFKFLCEKIVIKDVIKLKQPLKM